MLAVATVGYALVILDVTAMNVVAPVIQQQLDAPVSLVQWVINSYTLFLAALLMLGGALADRYGRRRLLAIGAITFAGASLAAGLAPDATFLIIARGVQGFGSALLVPAGLGLLAAHYPPAERGKAIGLWGGLSGLAAILGPLMGGFVSDWYSWRGLFFLYVPLALIVFFVALLRLPAAPRPPDPRPLDLPGAAWVTLGLLGVTYALIRAGVAGWADPRVASALVVGVLLLAAFFYVQHRKEKPMLELSVFRDRDHSGAQLVTFLIYFALAAGMLFVPMRLMTVDGWSAGWAGVAMLPTLVMIGLLAPRFGALLPRYGARLLVTVGALVAAIGYFLMGLPGPETSYFTGIFWGLTLVGLGMAMIISPLTTTVLSTVASGETARAAGLNNAISRLGALFAIALAGVIALAAQGPVIAQGLAEMELDGDEEQAAWEARTDLAHATAPEGLEPHERDRLQELYAEGFLQAYRVVQWLMAAAALLGALAAWVVLSPRAGR